MTGQPPTPGPPVDGGRAAQGAVRSGPALRIGVGLEQCLGPVPGGTGRYSREVAAALAATAAPDAVVRGWTAWHRDVSAAEVPGVDGPHRLPLPRRGLILAWDAGSPPVPTGVDVVHALTLLAPPRRQRPLVVTIHDAVPWTHPETLTPRGVTWHRRAAARAAREADAIVVPSRAVAGELAQVLPLGDRVHVVPHGVSAALAPPPDAEERAARLALPTGGFALSLATLEPRKGLDVLLAALAEPSLAESDLALVLVGQPGWGGVDPVAEAARLGLPPERVRVLGRLADEDLAVVLSRASMLVMPSRAEGFGLPVLEGMAAGVPVVHSDAPALVEVGGPATVVVPRERPGPLAEAMRGVYDDAAWRNRLVAAGLERAGEYSWEAAAHALWMLYAELVGVTA